jgi:hypothetical protein
MGRENPGQPYVMKPTRQTIFRRLAALYARMEAQYQAAAVELGLDCQGCTQNCCVSHFQHHTRVEWAYLWQGLKALPEEKRQIYLTRAKENLDSVQKSLAVGMTPNVMCPLNDDGLCGVYGHRLMICRLHGVPNRLSLPDGRTMNFPGCWQAQDLVKEREAKGELVPVMERTPLYKELMLLERDFLGKRFGKEPKVDLTLAEMLVAGPPKP